LGYAAYTFAIGGLAYWMPAFLRTGRGIPRIEATVNFAPSWVVTGFVHLWRGWMGAITLRNFTAIVFVALGGCHLGAAPFVWLGPHNALYADVHGITL